MITPQDINFAHTQKERFGYRLILDAPQPTTPLCVNPDAPAFDPAPWNVWPAHVANNCYAYAANHNVRRYYAPYPGESVDPTWGTQTQKAPTFSDYIDTLIRGCKLDGLKQTGSQLVQKEGFYTIALFATQEVIAPQCARKPDFHWMRQNNDGTWSHKGGKEMAHLLVDDNDTPIRDVSTIHMVTDTRLKGNENIRYAYDFVSYFLVPQNGLRVGVEATRFVPPPKVALRKGPLSYTP